MLHEHAITYQNHLSMLDLNYITKKANKLGSCGRTVVHVCEEIDQEGTHIYFDVIGGRFEQRGS